MLLRDRAHSIAYFELIQLHPTSPIPVLSDRKFCPIRFSLVFRRKQIKVHHSSCTFSAKWLTSLSYKFAEHSGPQMPREEISVGIWETASEEKE